MKHTPGTWARDGTIIFSNAGVAIAIMANYAANTADTKPLSLSDGGDAWKQMAVDADLLCAAPKLLDALRRARNIIGPFPCPDAESLVIIDTLLDRLEGE